MTEIDRQLPLGEEIVLDHVGHFVRDAQAAIPALKRAGFAPTPVSVQVAPDGGPTGTGNVCAMLPRGYVEVLFKTADTALGREFEAALVRYSGVQLVAFAVADAGVWHRRLGESGFRTRPIAPFSRPVGTATGTATASFTVARVEPGEMAEGRIQLLTHHSEDAVWQSRWLAHPNGACGLASVVMVVGDVAEAAARYARFIRRPAAAIGCGCVVRLDRGSVALISSDAWAAALAEIAVPSLPFIAGYGITVRSLDAAAAALHAGGLGSRRVGATLVAPFPEELGRGGWFFGEAGQPSLFG